MAKKKRLQSKARRKVTKKTANQSQIPMWGWFTGGGVLLVLVVAGLFYLGVQEPPAAKSDIEGLVILPDPGAGHEEGDIHYDHDVPAGGSHSSVWQNCGIYDQPVAEENIIHSMEHGAVWLAYQPEMPVDQVEKLREVVRRERSRQAEPLIVMAPVPNLDSPIVATAWRVQLNLDDAADERLVQFVNRYQKGPFTPEPGANCVGGIGEPIS